MPVEGESMFVIHVDVGSGIGAGFAFSMLNCLASFVNSRTGRVSCLHCPISIYRRAQYVSSFSKFLHRIFLVKASL